MTSCPHSAPDIVRRETAGVPRDWPEDVHPVLQRVYAARGVLCPQDANHRLAGLLPPQNLPGIDPAVSLLIGAIERQRSIMVAADFDCDGATGAAIAVRGLRALGAQRVGFVVPHRLLHGYGLTPALVATLQPAPDLIVTVDNGIASQAGVAAAKSRGCAVIVTDHHLPGATLPEADAIVNPQLGSDSAFRNLCGAGVMFYLLLALRARLRGEGAFSSTPEPDLSSLLDLVALATVADLVPLDRNNRILVEAGLRRIRNGRACAGIAALIEVAGCDARTLGASGLGFSIAPRINAAGRLEDMALGIECLLTGDAGRARELAALLHGINAGRRDLQETMVADAEAMLRGVDAGSAVGVALFDPAWHQGVVGLVAAKIRERLNRPVVAFAPAGEEDPESLRGSARSIPGFHIRDVLAEVDARHPGLIVRFGGHAMAAGLSLRANDYARFAGCFDAVARERIGEHALRPVLYSDGELAPQEFDLALARQLSEAGPWGQGFPAPLFDNLFDCKGWRRMGAEQRHLRLELRDPRDGRSVDAVMFNAPPEAPPARMRAAYELVANQWRGRESAHLLLRHIERV